MIECDRGLPYNIITINKWEITKENGIMSTISYAQVSRLTECLERPVIQNTINELVPILKPSVGRTVYLVAKKMALGAIDLGIDVRQSRAVAHARFPNVRGN